MGGGGSKRQVSGYRYLFGEHIVLCRNRIAVLAVEFQEKRAWTGFARGGDSIIVDKPDLFGGTKKEGGIVGTIDVLDGAAAQGQNDYLVTHLGAAVSAYRYVSSLVFRQVERGTNPYPKTPTFKVTDTEIFQQWESSTALFVRSVSINNSFIYIALDGSGSMDASRVATMKAAATSLLNGLRGSVGNSIMMVHYAALGASGSVWPGLWGDIQRDNCTDEDYGALLAWVDGIAVHAVGGTDYNRAVAPAPGFFSGAITESYSTSGETRGDTTYGALARQDEIIAANESAGVKADKAAGLTRKVMFFLSDGFATSFSHVAAKDTLDTIPNLEVFTVGIETAGDLAYIDNTASDGVPVVSGTDVGALAQAFTVPFTDWLDLNPVHIIRHLLCSTDTDALVNTGLIGDSYAAAATQLYAEGFGLSMLVRNDKKISEVVDEVCRHINAATYFSSQTGKHEIKLIRDDYVLGTLYEFNTANVSEWGTDINRELADKLPNRVVVTYRAQENNDKRSVTVINGASIAATAGEYRTLKIDYPGIRDATLAHQVADRDLRSEAAAKWAGSIVVPYLPQSLNVGSAFRLVNPALQLDGVMRAAKITRFIDGGHGARIQFTEDVYSLAGVPSILQDDITEESVFPTDAADYFVGEAPYFLAYLELGAADLSAALADNEDTGYLHVALATPGASHINYDVVTLNPADTGWYIQGTSQFTPVKTSQAAITEDPTETAFDFASFAGLESVRQGTVALLGDEVVRVAGYTTLGGGGFSFELVRGCLDTVPTAHPIGTPLLFFSDVYYGDDEVYVAGDELTLRTRTATTSARQALNSAMESVVTFTSRAARPYPPGDLLIDASRVQRQMFVDTDTPTLTWKHRNRLTQISAEPEGYLAGDITPEAGTTYIVQIEAFDAADVSLGVLSSVDVGLVNSYVIPSWPAQDPETDYLRVSVHTTRDAYLSWTAPHLDVIIPHGFGTAFGVSFGG